MQISKNTSYFSLLIFSSLFSLLILSGCGNNPEKVSEKTPEISEEKYQNSENSENTEEYKYEKKSDKKNDESEKLEKPDPLSELLSGSIAPVEKTYTLSEISKHNTQDDCWTVVNGTVANVTSFFGVHPGGDDNLLKACGKDATTLFESVKKHDPKGYAKFQEFSIGTLNK